jgi:hypothetical protein
MFEGVSPSSRRIIVVGARSSFNFIGSKGYIGVSLYMADTTITGIENSCGKKLIFNDVNLLLQLNKFGRLQTWQQDLRLP